MGPPNAVNRMIPSCLKWLYIWTHIVQTVRLLYQKLCHPPSEPRNKPSYFPLYWLFNRDPYNGLSKSPYNWVVLKSPIYIYTLNNQFVSLLKLLVSLHPTCPSTAYLVYAGTVLSGEEGQTAVLQVPKPRCREI